MDTPETSSILVAIKPSSSFLHELLNIIMQLITKAATVKMFIFLFIILWFILINELNYIAKSLIILNAFSKTF